MCVSTKALVTMIPCLIVLVMLSTVFASRFLTSCFACHLVDLHVMTFVAIIVAVLSLPSMVWSCLGYWFTGSVGSENQNIISHELTCIADSWITGSTSSS